MECYFSLIVALTAATCFSSTTFNRSVTSPSILMTSSGEEEGEFQMSFEKEPEDVVAVRDQPIIMDCLLASSSSSSSSSASSSASALSASSSSSSKPLSSSEAAATSTTPSSSSSSLSYRYPEDLLKQVIWLKDGLPIQIDDKRMTLLSNGSLFMRNSGEERLRRNDEGGYQCRYTFNQRYTFNHGFSAVQRYAVVSRNAMLKLPYVDKSWSEEPQQPSPLAIGDSIILGCSVQALPPVKVKWFKDDQEIEIGKTNSARKSFIHSDGALEMTEVAKSQFGRYKCKVRNESDKKWKTSKTVSIDEENELDANMDSPPAFFYKPRDVTVTEGKELLLHCGANGRDRNGAPVVIKWLKNGDILDLNKADVRRSIIGRGSLYIRDALREDSAYYTCRASNSEDVIESTAYVTVTSPPTFVGKLKSIISEVNNDIEMSCTVHGSPKPSVIWLKNGRPIVEELGVVKFENKNDDGDYKLKIFGSCPNDTGIYQCFATNEVGSTQIGAMITVSKDDSDEAFDHHNNSLLDVHVQKVEDQSMALSWVTSDAPGAAYFVRWREITSSRIRSLKTSENVATLNDLLPSRNYSVSVSRLDGDSQHVTHLLVQTKDAESKEPVVENLRAIPLSSRSILLSWKFRKAVFVRSMSLVYQLEDPSLNCTEVRMDLPAEVGSIRVDHLRPYSLYRFMLGGDDINAPRKTSSSPVEVLCQTYSESPGSPPQDVNVEADEHNNILMSWEQPKEANGPITGFKVKYKTRSSRSSLVTVATDSKQRHLELSGFNDGQEMVFRVQALNVNGSGPFSPWVSIKSSHKKLDESVVPGQPSSLNVRSFGNMVFATWLPPADRSIAIKGYILSYGIGIPEVFKQMFDAKHRQYTVKNLKPSSEYVISLRAFNEAGEGEPLYNSIVTGELNTFITQLPLIPPVGLKATILSSTSILLSWSDASVSSRSFDGMPDFAAFANERGIRDKLYTVRYNLKASKKYKFINTTQLSIIIGDLRADTEYEFSVKVRLKNNRASTWSLSVFNRTKETAPSTAPRDLTPLVMDGHFNSVILNWQPPKTPNGQVTGYLIHYTTNVSHDEKNWVTEGVLGERLTATIRGLTPETTYYFRVQARNSAGEGPLSSIVLLKTPKNQKVPNIMDSQEEEEHFPHRKFYKVRQSTSTSPPAPLGDEIPQWLFWVVVISLVLFVLFSILSLVAVLRCRRLIKPEQRRGQKSKASSEAQNITESLLLSPSALSHSSHLHQYPVPPDVCQNHAELDSIAKVNADQSSTTTTNSRRMERKEMEDQGGICGSFYYFPSKISVSGSFKRGASSYNPGWAYPSSFNIKDQLSAGENETDQPAINVQHRVSENPYFIPMEHKINLFDTFQKKAEVPEEGRKRLSDVPPLANAPRVDAGDMNDAKNIKPVFASLNDPPLTRSVTLAADKDSNSKDISLRQNGVPDGFPKSSRMSDSVN